jgi:hypothetical protein
LPAGITSRNIGGVTADNPNRKGTSGGAFGAGQPNENFVGNITVPMANYLKGAVHVAEFRNTNIIGDGDKWDGYIGGIDPDMILPAVTNVGLIGDYGGIIINNRIGGQIRGVLDIQGNAPLRLYNDNMNGYLNLWKVTGNIGVNKFYVISIKDLNGIQYVNKVGFGTPEPASVIIYPKKYNPSAIDNTALGLTPRNRAFYDGTTPKITPTADSSIATVYRGSDTSGSQQVPPLGEQNWIDEANDNNGAAPAFQSYSSAPKWTATAFNAVPVE